ncbi:unnamed protein product [Effrenium voratum]|uniref:Uncharacterized protein n=1 Tax=Effrenium voratum TaxID=2562239 RepID=A0AA36JFU8_9DINO|nr:unnamed protein product [Effrenium voratum]
MAFPVPTLQLAGKTPQLTAAYSDDDFDDEEVTSDSEGDAALLAAQGDERMPIARTFLRPGSPEPPVGNAGTERTLDPRAYLEDDNARDRWDAAVSMSGAREAPIRVRAPLDEAPGWRMGVSAPELGGRANLLDEESEGDPNQAEGDEARNYPGYSWRETLNRFPALLQLYPLAAASEAGLEDPASEAGGRALSALDGLEGNEEYLNGHPGSAQKLPPSANQVSPPRSANSAGAASTPRSARKAEVPVAKDEPQVRRSSETPGPSIATPMSGRVDQTEKVGLAASESWSKLDLADAWAEVERARRDLEQRERGLQQREAALRRSEARQRASERQLDEMRRRLEDYSEELEESMATVLAQQESLKEEQRRSAELHARARQMLEARRNGRKRREEMVPAFP